MSAKSSRNSIASSLIGNVLEWYDFAIYGYFASAIGLAFFPESDPSVQILMAFSIFAIGYLMRPIGGALFGHIGDKYGRKLALNISVAAMAIPTFLVSILPDYNAWGIWATYILILLRLIQGLSVGGEFTTSIIYLVTHAPKGKKALMGALATCGAVGGVLLGSLTGDLMHHLMSEDMINDWGWRVPFLFGLIIGLVGFLMRRHMIDDVPSTPKKLPILEVFQNHRPVLFNISGLAVLNAVGFYLIFVYLVGWFKIVDHLSPSQALDINSISMILFVIIICIAGYLSDKVGAKNIMKIATVGVFIFSIPLFNLMNHHNEQYILLGQLGFAILLGSYFGGLNSILVLSTPAHIRCTLIAVGYNLTLGVVGGLTPLAAAWLLDKTENPISPAYMLMFACFITLIALFKNNYKEHY